MREINKKIVVVSKSMVKGPLGLRESWRSYWYSDFIL